jgi:hypothetical protein
MLLAAAIGLTSISFGCAKTYQLDSDFGATPGLTSQERAQAISRDQDYDGKMMIDDFDHLFLLRPASQLTIWNVR